MEREPRAELESLLDSIAERRKTARAAFGGMAFYYLMAAQLLVSNPELLEELRVEANMTAPFGVDEFFRLEAKMAKDSARPELQLMVTDEEHALIEAIISASAIKITQAQPIEVDDGDTDESDT